MIRWRMNGVTYSGEAGEFRFTLGSANMNAWWWSAWRVGFAGKRYERRGWSDDDTAARAAAEKALGELERKVTTKRKGA